MTNRRQFFLRAAAFAAGASALATGSALAETPLLIGLTGAPEHAGRLAWPHPSGLQIYTVREEYARNPLRTLEQVARIGYREVELINVDKIPAPRLRHYLAQTHLRAVGGHFGYGETAAHWQKIAELAHRVGLHYVVCPFANASDEAGWKKIAATFNLAGRICHRAGLQFAYHNHLQEFRPIGKTTGYAILAAHTDPARVQLEMDVFWLTYAGQNPIEYFHRYPGRYTLLHAKDMKKKLGYHWNPREFPPRGHDPFTEVGRGRIDWRAIFAHAKLAGVKHVFVEQDETRRPPIEAAAISYRYLHQLRLR